MADKNILSLTFDDSATTNYETSSLFVSQVAPRNVNIANNVPRGDVTFEFSTPKDTFCDLFKTYMSMDYEITAGADGDIQAYFHNRTILPCMFMRAEVYVNGTKIVSSNNYTFDGILSRRLQFGYDYNKSVNGIYNIPLIKDDAKDNSSDFPASKPGKYKAIDTLDSFWLRQSEGLMVPPDSNVRMVFTIDDSYLGKAHMKTAAAALKAGVELKVNSFTMNPCFYVNPGQVRGDGYRLRFIQLNSFKTLINKDAEANTLQYTISPTIMKACLTHVPVTYDQAVTVAAAKWDAAFLFNSPLALTTCQFKVGNVVFPQSPYSMLYGWEGVYQDYINHTQQIAKDSGKEPFKYFNNEATGGANSLTLNDRNNWGRITLAPIVKDRSDPTNTLEVRTTFAKAPANTYQILTSLEEQSVMLVKTGDTISTVPTI